MKLYFVPKWTLPFTYGFALYKLIVVAYDDKPDTDVPYIIAHEAEHVRQWTEIGFFKFPFQYLWELRKGYSNNKFEIEAEREGMVNRHKYLKCWEK